MFLYSIRIFFYIKEIKSLGVLGYFASAWMLKNTLIPVRMYEVLQSVKWGSIVANDIS